MKLRFKPSMLTPAKIIATCMIVGPLIGLLVLYLVLLGITAWVGLQSVMSNAPAKGGPMVGLVWLALLALLPIFAIVGTAVVALQTFVTGVMLSVIHWLQLPERIAKLLPVLPLSLVCFVLAFAAGLAISVVISPSEAPKQLKNLGPLSLQFAAAFSSGVCYLIARHWSVFGARRSPPQRALQGGA